MSNDRLTVARLTVQETFNEMKKSDVADVFLKLAYTEMEQSLIAVAGLVTGQRDLSGVAVEGIENCVFSTISENVKNIVLSDDQGFTPSDMTQIFMLASEMISQTTLRIRQSE